MTRTAEKDVRSALVGCHRVQRRLAMARTCTMKPEERERLEAARYGARLVEKKLLALLGAEGTKR